MSRVLMIVLGTVLLANAGLGLYLLLRQQAPAEEPALIPPELGRELSLLKPGPQPEPRRPAGNELAADPPSYPTPDPELRSPAAGAGVTAAAGSASLPTSELSCFYWGPFRNETEARNKLSELQDGGLITPASGARVSRTSVQRDPEFMIFVGPFTSLGAARAARDELEARGSEAHVVTRDERLVVSTGVFSQRQFAADQTTKLREWGFEPKQSELIRNQRMYFLLADIATVGNGGAAARADVPGAAGRCDDIASQYGIL